MRASCGASVARSGRRVFPPPWVGRARVFLKRRLRTERGGRWDDGCFMRAVCQRVSSARVTVAGTAVGEIGRGLVVLLGIARADVAGQADRLAGKVARLRVFEDEQG